MTENKLEGTWKMIDISNIYDSLSVERWQFDSDNRLKIFHDVNGVADTTPISILHYKAKSYRKLTIEPIDGGGQTEYCREWKISKLTKDVLIMTYLSGGLVQKEFVKM
jgi:hypothetical protein